MGQFFKREEGFTLVELMVVVAIIGILSAVAIPNFKKYQAKSKTSEAKLQLASVYSAETALQSDYDSFGSCLTDMGYTAAGRGYYVVGFGAESSTANGNIVTAGGACADGSFQLAPTVVPPVGNLDAKSNIGTVLADNALFPKNSTAVAPAVPDTGDTFVAGAVGRISADGGNQYDVWSVDENKNILNETIGF